MNTLNTKTPIIDIHAHVLDIFGTGKMNISFDELVAHMDWLENTHATKAFTCVLPIEPYCKSNEVYKLSKLDARILPFYSLNFTKTDDEIVEDIKLNAHKYYGMKLHTIIQDIDFDDARVFAAVHAFEKYVHGKPIIFHSGREDYFRDSGKVFDKTKSNPKKARLLVDNFPRTKFLMAHAGLSEPKSWHKNFVGAENVHVDTTFQGMRRIRKLVDDYSLERVHYGTDFPYNVPLHGSYKYDTTKAVLKRLASDEYQKITCDNSLELLGITKKELFERLS